MRLLLHGDRVVIVTSSSHLVQLRTQDIIYKTNIRKLKYMEKKADLQEILGSKE